MDSPSPSYPQVTPAARPPLNGLAVAALVFGLVCVVPVVGIVLGSIALTQIGRTGERGKGMAVTGLVLSTVSTLVFAVVLVSGVAAFTKGFSDGLADGMPDGNTLFTLRKGDCFDTPGDKVVAKVANAATVPCTRTHTGEVFGVFQVAGENSGFPGDASITKTAENRCWELENVYAMDTWAIPQDVDVYYFAPSSSTWLHDDHEVTCFFGRDGGPLKGSLRQDATTLDEHQLAYLKAANTINDAKSAPPEAEYVKDDLKGYKEWAQDVTRALDEEARILHGHVWPAAAEQHVAALEAKIDAARAHWAKAAAAKDADTYYDHYEAAERLSGYEEAVRARAALGLATSDAAVDS
ncbi:DUF4190 domain-containing protein [Streptomyces sp. NPDC058691]|uniref:DUF4190 domain-containing protein n=1 Tax=Streptomyces sp. NPDC058691 TaxID=3346601 RepID=UPI00365BDD94